MEAFKQVMLHFLLLFGVMFARAEKVMRPKLKDMKNWSDTAYVKHTIAFEPNEPHINITVDVLQELHDVDFHMEGTVAVKNDHNYYWNFNTTFNLCRILNWRNASPIGTLVHAYLKEYGNFPENCPIQKGQYYIHRFWVPEDPAMSEFPEVDFDFKISSQLLDANHKRTPLAEDRFLGEVVVQDVTNVNRGILSMLPKAG